MDICTIDQRQQILINRADIHTSSSIFSSTVQLQQMLTSLHGYDEVETTLIDIVQHRTYVTLIDVDRN